MQFQSVVELSKSAREPHPIVPLSNAWGFVCSLGSVSDQGRVRGAAAAAPLYAQKLSTDLLIHLPDGRSLATETTAVGRWRAFAYKCLPLIGHRPEI